MNLLIEAMLDPIHLISEYARFPSVSTDPQFADGMRGARNYMVDKLKSLGFAVELVDTPRHPIILAERGGAHEDWPHIVIYGHYDVQPADPVEKWTSPPFAPEVRNGRLYGRGTADNKGPQGVQLAALARLLEKQPDLPLRITWLIEGEEEMGSPSFPEFLRQYRERLARADLILLSDTGSPNPEQVTITTALRGLIGFEVELTGPKVDLHSGVHGGAILNPIEALAKLCALLHTEDGRVNVPGFYDNVVEPQAWEREELKKLPTSEDAYQAFLGVKAFRSPRGYSPLEAVRFAPTLEFNGIGGGYQGAGSKTVIPSRAFVKITCRLVADQQPQEIYDLIVKTLQERCPVGVTELKFSQPEGGAAYLVVPPGRPNTPADQPATLAKAFKVADQAIAEAFGRAPLYLREGGSIPIIGQMKAVTGLDSLMIGLFMPEDNLHAPDESFHLGMLEKGVAAYERIFAELAHP